VKFLNPNFSAHMIQGMVQSGQATLEQANEQFAMPRYLLGLLIFPVRRNIEKPTKDGGKKKNANRSN